jgi:hypothetical protein
VQYEILSAHRDELCHRQKTGDRKQVTRRDDYLHVHGSEVIVLSVASFVFERCESLRLSDRTAAARGGVTAKSRDMDAMELPRLITPERQHRLVTATVTGYHGSTTWPETIVCGHARGTS